MATPTSSCDEVLKAGSAADLFGTNPARARIRYHRLASEVHPDTPGGSQEAMSRLNALWDEYNSRKPSDGARKAPAELTRNGRYVVLSEGDHWLVVDRVASDDVMPCNLGDFIAVAGESPVCTLECTSSKLIAQPNGSHPAYACAKDPRYGGFVTLDELKDRLPGGVLQAEDLAWITKRVIHLASVIGKCELSFVGEARDWMCVATEEHMLVVTAPWELEPSDGSVRDQRKVVSSFYDCIWPAIALDSASIRIMRFIEGTVVDTVTESAQIMDEFNELLVELFGGFRFHEMRLLEKS